MLTIAKRGRSLLNNDLPVKETDIEEGNIPFFLIDDEYGVTADNYCYMLCYKKKMNRSVKNEDDVITHIESYYNWTPLKYTNTFQSIIECYMTIKERKLSSRLVKNKDYKEFINIQNEIKDIISKAFDTNGVNKEFVSFCDLIDHKEKLLQEIEELSALKDKVVDMANDLLNIIKKKRKIIINETEGKKHRIKLEE